MVIVVMVVMVGYGGEELSYISVYLELTKTLLEKLADLRLCASKRSLSEYAN